MNTRKYPRTLQEAFGPYTSRDFVEPVPRSHRVFALLYVIAILALITIAKISERNLLTGVPIKDDTGALTITCFGPLKRSPTVNLNKVEKKNDTNRT